MSSSVKAETKMDDMDLFKRAKEKALGTLKRDELLFLKNKEMKELKKIKKNQIKETAKLKLIGEIKDIRRQNRKKSHPFMEGVGKFAKNAATAIGKNMSEHERNQNTLKQSTSKKQVEGTNFFS